MRSEAYANEALAARAPSAGHVVSGYKITTKPDPKKHWLYRLLGI